MKIRGYYIVACILSLNISSCTLEQKEELVQTVSGYDRETSLHTLQDHVVSFRCVQLQRTKGTAISNIEKVEMVDSTLLIAADGRLMAFDMDGHYLRTYGGIIPHYRKASSFYLDEYNNVVVVDADSGRLVTFDMQGQYMKTEKVNPALLVDVQDICRIDKNTLFMSKYIHTGANTLFELVDVKNEQVEDLARSAMKTSGAKVRIGMHPFSRLGESVRWIRPFSKRIEGYNVECPLLINSSKKEPRTEMLQHIDDFSVAIYHPFMQDEMFVGFTDIFETKDYIVLFCLDVECVVINKRTWKSERYVYGSSGGFECLPFFGIKTSNAHFLVGLLFPLELEQIRVEDITNEGLRKLLDVKQHMNKNGNPILLLYEV